jgi:hypothetical protein
MIKFCSLKNLETASFYCDENFSEELNHAPLTNIKDIIFADRFELGFFADWRGSTGDQYAKRILMEDGICMTFNPINAHLIFRNDTVDPIFLDEFRQLPSEMRPELWSIETGYTSNGLPYYPLKSLRKGIEGGFKVDVGSFIDLFEDIDTRCRKDPRNIKIALHHPAEVALQSSFISVPFNKSVSMMVKPKITTTSDSLRHYDPEV